MLGKIVRSIFHQNSTANFSIKLHYEVLGCGGPCERGLFLVFRDLGLRSPPPSTEPKNPQKPEKSQKSLPRGVWDPPNPDPEKVQKKSPKSQEKSLKINYFLDFSDFFFGLFRGPGSGGPKLPSGDFFETFRVLGVFGSVDGGGDLKFGVGLWLKGGKRPPPPRFQPY